MERRNIPVADVIAFVKFEFLDLFVETFEIIFHLQQKNYLQEKNKLIHNHRIFKGSLPELMF